MREPDDLPIFRPRMGGGRPSGARSASPSFRRTLLGRLGRTARTGGTARSRVAVRPAGADARRVVVKAHYVRMNARGATAAALHLRYIERDGVERDGSKGVLYDADGPARRESFEEPRLRERHQFRLIVSPEDAAELDLTAFVRRFMAQVEKDVGRKLEWAAVNHFDTEHPHAHIVLRGVDGQGKEVRLDRGYISNGLRGRAQAIATEELGPRLDHDVERTRLREVTQERFTSLDREIERRAKDGQVEGRSQKAQGPIDESALVARLQHLEQMRLATRVSRTGWSLHEGWQAELRDLGARGDILKQIHRAVRGDPARYRIVSPGQPLDAGNGGGERLVVGRVAGKGLSDELKGAFYALIETPNGGAYHVPLDARSAQDVREGDLVSLRTEEKRDRKAEGAPRRQLVLRKLPLSMDEQTRYPGPVWLDRLEPASLAPYGFGAELRRRVEQRRDALRELGIAADGPGGLERLRELERRDVANDVAGSTAKSFVPDVPDSFRGRVHLHATPAGNAYAVVSDETRFIVLQATAALQAMKGKGVVIDRDAEGRAVVRSRMDRGLE